MARGEAAALAGRRAGRGAKDGAGIKRREAVQAIWCAGEKGITLGELSRRLGLVGCEVISLVSERNDVVDATEPGRGLVFYWAGKPRKDKEAVE